MTTPADRPTLTGEDIMRHLEAKAEKEAAAEKTDHKAAPATEKKG